LKSYVVSSRKVFSLEESAGGNFSAIISHLYRDEKLSPPLTGVYLSIPAYMPAEFVPKKYKDMYLSQTQTRMLPF
jgi:acetyl esterase/lipase